MKRKILIAVILFSLLSMTTLIITFIIVFKSQQISKDISHWGAFGSFLSSIIALLSLIILGYLTYYVSKYSTEENKNLFMYQKKLEAFDKLMSYSIRLNSLLPQLTLSVNRISREQVKTSPNQQRIIEEADVLTNLFNFFAEFHYFIHDLNPRYGYLFNYSFKSKEFQDLKKSCRCVFDETKEVSIRLSLGKIDTAFDTKSLLNLYHSLEPVINKLIREVANRN